MPTAIEKSRKKAGLRHVKSLQSMTEQLSEPDASISRRFHCLGHSKQTQRRCHLSAEGYMVYRPGMIKKTWAALKAEPVSSGSFTEIVRSMFCGYHDISNAYTEEIKEFLRLLWDNANFEEQDAFLVAIGKGLEDVQKELTATLEAGRNDAGPKELRMILHKNSQSSLDALRKMLGMDRVPPEEPVQSNVCAVDPPADKATYVRDASQLPSAEFSWPPFSDDSRDKGSKPRNGISNAIKIESSDDESSASSFEEPSNSPINWYSTAEATDADRTSFDQTRRSVDGLGKTNVPSTPPYQPRQNRSMDRRHFKTESPSSSLFSNDGLFGQRISPSIRHKGNEIKIFDAIENRAASRSPGRSYEDATELEDITFNFDHTPDSTPAGSSVSRRIIPTNNRSRSRPEERVATPSSNQSATPKPHTFLSPSPHGSKSRSSSTSGFTNNASAPAFSSSPRTSSTRPVSLSYMSQTQGEIASNIRSILRKPLEEDNKGTIYILQAPLFFTTFPPATSQNEIWLKIGISRDVPKRIASLKAQCGIFDLIEIREDGDKPFTEPTSMENLRRIERLCHAQLNNYRRRMNCQEGNTACKVIHTEWFAVPESVAKETVRLWVRFFTQNPYGEYGVLNEYWTKRVSDPQFLSLETSEEEDTAVEDVSVAAWRGWLDEGIEGRCRRQGNRYH